MPVLDTPKIREAVDNGVALLDRELPDWRDRVDKARLDMSSACGCILGQAYDEGHLAVESGWRLGLRALGLDFISDELTIDRAQHYGFTLSERDLKRIPIRELAWIELRAEWLRRLP